MSSIHEHHRPTPSQLRTGLLVHAIAYVVVNLILLVVDLSSPGGLWFFWPLLGWGVGLGYHAWVVNRHTRT